MNSHPESGTLETEEVPLSDLQRILQRMDLGLIPLAKDDRALLDSLPRLGPLNWYHGGRAVQIARTGRIQRVRHEAQESVLLDDGGGLIWIGEEWRHSLAALRRTGTQGPASLILFSHRGERMLQVDLPEDMSSEFVKALIQEHKGCINCLRHAPAGPNLRQTPHRSQQSAPCPCPCGVLSEAWREGTSRADLDARLRGLGVDRLEALAALEGRHGRRLHPEEAFRFLARCAELGMPVLTEVVRAQAVVALEARWNRFETSGALWELGAAEATLWIAPEVDPAFWWVRQGDAYRLEIYDPSGERVLGMALRGASGIQMARDLDWTLEGTHP